MRKHIAPLALFVLLCVTTITQAQLTLIQRSTGLDALDWEEDPDEIFDTPAATGGGMRRVGACCG